MKTLIITAVALGLGFSVLRRSHGAILNGHAAHSSDSTMLVVDPDPAGIGTYLVSAVLLALGIAIYLYMLIGDARANRGQEQDGREAAAETGARGQLR